MDLEARARIHEALGDPHRLAVVDALALTDRSPGDLADLTGLAPNLLAHHLRVLERAGVVTVRRSEGDGRRRYVHLEHPAVAAPVDPPGRADRVVFVCTHNSARSQLAAALWQRRVGGPVASAGTDPASSVHPGARAVGADHGLDLGDAAPRLVTDDLLAGSVVVSVCDQAAEELGHRRALHWSIPDPVRVGTDAAFADAFEQVATWVERLQPREKD